MKKTKHSLQIPRLLIDSTTSKSTLLSFLVCVLVLTRAILWTPVLAFRFVAPNKDLVKEHDVIVALFAIYLSNDDLQLVL